MPRKGQAYPIDAEWRRRVREGIDKLEISDAEFCRRAHISKSSLSQALDGVHHQSTLVPIIHKALGWPAPRGLFMAKDSEEVVEIVGRMHPDDKIALREMALRLEDLRKRR